MDEATRRRNPRKAAVTQSGIDLMIRGAKAAGLTITGIETLPDGTVRVLTSDLPTAPPDRLSEWRAVELKRDQMGGSQGDLDQIERQATELAAPQGEGAIDSPTNAERPLKRLAYGVKEAAEALSLGKSTIWRWIKEGELPAVKLGMRTLILADDLQALTSRRRVALGPGRAVGRKW